MTARVVLAADFLLKYAAGLGGGLLAAGADVLMVSRDHGGEFGGDAAAARAMLAARVGDRTVLVPGRPREPGALGAVVAARRRVARWAPQVVHLQERVVNDPRLLLVAGARPRRYALTVHDPVAHPGDRPRTGVKAAADRALLRGAALLFVHAEALRDELVEHARPRCPVVVVPHGADEPPPVRPLPARPTLLFFGRISHYKGTDVLLDALPHVWDAVPDAHVVVAGAGDLPDHAALADPRVTVRHEHVPEEDVPALFAGATAVVLPYRQASQSGVGSLAKTYGRAAIVTRVGGLPELVADGSGVVVEPEDPDALASAAVALLTDASRAERLGRRGADALHSAAAWPRVAETTLEAYARHGLLRPARS